MSLAGSLVNSDISIGVALMKSVPAFVVYAVATVLISYFV
jgi:hypothetical protein